MAKYKLGDIAPVQQGIVPKAEEYWLLNLDMVESTTGRIIDYVYCGEDEIGNSTVKFDTENVLYSKLRPYLNKVVLPEKAGYATSEMLPMRPDQNKITREYFTYFLRSPGFVSYINEKTSGAKMPRANSADLKAYEIDCPSIDEQKRITEQFDRITSIISFRENELTMLDELIKARFVELFGDPKINGKKWDTGTVSQFYEVKGGKRIPKGMGYADGITAHPYLRATDMKNETILDDDIHYIDEDVFEKIKRYTVKGGDIYLTNVGVNLGMAGVIPDKYDGANLTENAVKLVPKTNLVLDGLFLAHYINSPGIQDYINERKMSVGVPKLAIFRIETMPLILPPMNLQIEFINFCKQVDKSKFVVQKALDETQKLFDSLMQEYFG